MALRLPPPTSAPLQVTSFRYPACASPAGRKSEAAPGTTFQENGRRRPFPRPTGLTDLISLGPAKKSISSGSGTGLTWSFGLILLVFKHARQQEQKWSVGLDHPSSPRGTLEETLMNYLGGAPWALQYQPLTLMNDHIIGSNYSDISIQPNQIVQLNYIFSGRSS